MSLAKTIAWATLATGASAFTFTWQRREAVQLRAQLNRVQTAGASAGVATSAEKTFAPKGAVPAVAPESGAAMADYYRWLVGLYRLDLSRVPREITGRINYDSMARWARDDPPAARGQAQRVRDPAARAEALAAVASQWAAQNPAAATAWVKGLPDGPERNRVLLSLIEQLAGNNPSAALALVPEISSKASNDLDVWEDNGFREQYSQGNAVIEIFSRWAFRDPLAAFNATASVNPGWRKYATGGVVDAVNARTFPVLVPYVASRFLEDPSAGRDQLSTLGNFFFRAGLAGPERATTWLDALPESDAKWNLRRQLLNSWSDQVDPQAALAYVETLPAGPKQDSLLAAVLPDLVRWYPDDAVKEMSALPSGPTRDALIKSLIEARVAGDPAGAFDLWQSLSNDIARANEATQAVFTGESIIEGIDPIATEAWIQLLPHGDVRDGVVKRFISSESGVYPDLLVPWLAQIDDDQTRQNTTATLAATWLKSDPVAASAWLAQTDLPEKQKQKLLGTAMMP
jgi:hypothetical protein